MNKNRTSCIFDSWSEISSYILGFWLADGCIFFRRKRDRIYKIWDIVNTDKQIIFDIARILNHSFRRFSKPKKKHHKQCYIIRIFSPGMFDFCYDLVGTTHKSHTQFDLPQVPSQYFRHFVRGLFDGDGSICWKSYKTRHSKIVHAIQSSFTAGLQTSYLGRLRDKLRATIGTGMKKITIGKENQKLTFNQYDTMLLCQWMYKNATIFMCRKKAVWDSADADKIKQSTKFFSNKV